MRILMGRLIPADVMLVSIRIQAMAFTKNSNLLIHNQRCVTLVTTKKQQNEFAIPRLMLTNGHWSMLNEIMLEPKLIS